MYRNLWLKLVLVFTLIILYPCFRSWLSLILWLKRLDILITKYNHILKELIDHNQGLFILFI